MTADLVIKGCTALVHGKHGEIGFAENSGIVVRDGIIQTVTSAGDVAEVTTVERIDPRGSWPCPASSTAIRTHRWWR